MLKIIGKILCAIKRKHVWGRIYMGPLNGSVLNYPLKTCKRCGTVAPVKRRKAKVS